jgi:protoporphyrinogen oxidase
MVLGGHVAIVGAGVAGLRCAQVLNAAGIHVTLLESSDRVGGRVASDQVEGFTIDRGFQVINPAYPQVRRALNLDDLELGSFSPEIVVATASGRTRLGDPLRAPLAGLRSGLTGPGTRAGRLRFAFLAARLGLIDPRRWDIPQDQSAAEWFRSQGVNESTLRELIAPFMAGVLLEDDLETDAKTVALFIRTFLRGRPAVPRLGMGAIPAQMHQSLSRTTTITNCHVTKVGAKQLESTHGVIKADQVVLAVSAAALENFGFSLKGQRRVTTWWHRCVVGSGEDSRLVVDATSSGFTNSLELSASAPHYAPSGQHLFATSSNAPRDARDEAAKRACGRLHRIDADQLHLVSVSEITDALPVMAAGTSMTPLIERDGIILAGDVVATPSLQGAMASGERAARLLLAR